MAKKDRKNRESLGLLDLASIGPAPRRKLSIPPVKEFDDLKLFEQYLKDESWDNDFDFVHARLKYYPPFISSGETGDDPDAAKATMNKKSKQFVRRLLHHVDRHLCKEILELSGLVHDWKRTNKQDSFEKLVWTYEDRGNHGIDEANPRKFKVSMDVTCNNEDPMVVVDYKSVPIAVDDDESAIMD